MKSLLILPVVVFFVALILSPRSELVLPRCLAALAPLLLLALANWLGQPRRGLLSAVSVLTISSFLVTYVVSLSQLLPTVRSNARELAATVAERTGPTDLVVISPEWLASSFNRYYTPSVEQIDFPELKREGAVDFTNFLSRLQSEENARQAFLRLREAREQGRRVWLVIDRRKMGTDSAAGIHRLMSSDNYLLVGFARTAQLRVALDSLYGAPQMVLAGGATPRYEFLRALLYSAR
jgi:hypothetical protein